MENGRIHLGIASTAIPSAFKRNGNKVMRPSRYFCHMADVAEKNGLILSVFHPDCVNWPKQRVTAWVPVERGTPFGRWQSTSLTLPDVIYENVYVHLAMKGFTRDLRVRAKQHKIPLYNPGLPNKWGLHVLLSHSSLSKYLPKTEVLVNSAEAVKRVQEWETVYVKPVGGYGGMGVTRIVHQNDQFRVAVDRDRQGKSKTKRKMLTAFELRQFLNGKMGVKHLVQQGINRLELRGRKVDFRVVVARNHTAKWNVVGVVPKMTGSKDGVVTNIIAGGEKLTVRECLNMAKREGRNLALDKVEKCALEIADFIGSRFPKAAVLGFDIALDNRGNAFLIEMNPKPARSLLSAGDRMKLGENLVLFGKYLAKQD